jgi:hypothetical protein
MLLSSRSSNPARKQYAKLESKNDEKQTIICKTNRKKVLYKLSLERCAGSLRDLARGRARTLR